MLQNICILAVASNRIISLRHEKGQGSFYILLYCLKKKKFPVPCFIQIWHLEIVKLILSLNFKDSEDETMVA